MKNEIKRQKLTPVIQPRYFLLAVLSLVYVYLLYKDVLILKPKGGGRTQLFIISITIAVPELLIWTISLLSSMRLKSYAKTIRRSRDGIAMAYLADSLVFMSIYIVLICVSDNVTTLFKGTESLRTIVLLSNYLPLSIAFAASFLLSLAAIKFNQVTSFKLPKTWLYVPAGLFITFVGLFVWHFTRISSRELTAGEVPRFVTPVGTLMYTYVLPQVVLWGMGLFACIGIANYSLKVRGAIYKKLLDNLSKGVLIVFICIFLAQVFILSSFSINKFSLPLLLVYCLLTLGAFGFALIYKGTNSLIRLERI